MQRRANFDRPCDPTAWRGGVVKLGLRGPRPPSDCRRRGGGGGERAELSRATGGWGVSDGTELTRPAGGDARCGARAGGTAVWAVLFGGAGDHLDCGRAGRPGRDGKQAGAQANACSESRAPLGRRHRLLRSTVGRVGAAPVVAESPQAWQLRPAGDPHSRRRLRHRQKIPAAKPGRPLRTRVWRAGAWVASLGPLRDWQGPRAMVRQAGSGCAAAGLPN